MVMAYMAGLHFWWPKMTGRMYPEGWAKLSALLVFVGFNTTFFPQFILGYMGLPRRYHAYPPEFQVLNVLSTAGASILAVGYVLPMIYFLWSLRYGELAPPNPWNAVGLEWMTPSPPPTHNFDETPVVTWEAYDYEHQPQEEVTVGQPSDIQVAEHALQHHFADMEQQQETSTFGMWMFLLTEIMFFGGLFCAYLVYRASYYQAFVEGSQKMNIWLGATNTAVLICSSLTMALGVRAAQMGKPKLMAVLLLITIMFGFGFLGIKAIEYHEHWENHEFPGPNFHFETGDPAHPASDPQAHRDLLLALLGDDRPARAAHDHRRRPGDVDHDCRPAGSIYSVVLQSGGKRRLILALRRLSVDLFIPAALSDQQETWRLTMIIYKTVSIPARSKNISTRCPTLCPSLCTLRSGPR